MLKKKCGASKSRFAAPTPQNHLFLKREQILSKSIQKFQQIIIEQFQMIGKLEALNHVSLMSKCFLTHTLED